MSKISVIVPNYNHAKYLPQRLESIFNQTYQDFEVILLDDCSTDNSQEILEQYRTNLKVSAIVFNEQNSGSTFKQWDKGIALASGDYIWIAESDDWCEPTLLATLVKALNSHPNIVLGYVQSYYIIGDSVKWISKQDLLENFVNGNDFINQYLLRGNSIFNASMAVFRKSAYNEITNDYKKFKFCGDWLFWIEISLHGDVFISGKILNYFRKHDGDVSGKSYASGLNFVEDLQVLFILFDKKLINKSDFFSAINSRHISYKLKMNIFSQQMRSQIDTLFYSDEHTKKLRSKLLQNFESVHVNKSKLS